MCGGRYSGKGEYVKSELGISEIVGCNAEYDRLKTAKAVRDLHLLIKKIMLSGGDPMAHIQRLMADNPDIVIISDEIGYGVVPIDKFDREWREAVGRISCYVSKRAEKVIRVVCGIGNTIK
ncbi:MAG: bifunctional adenosylcobinamide kinase/adenosylcobinamide-phosphate guanylyltransferase [Hominilimicola sp.]